MRILFCGLSGFPNNKSAAVNRYVSMAKTMAVNNEIIFLNRISINRKNEFHDSFDFRVVNATNTEYRPNFFFKRNLLKLFSPFYEFNKIRNLNRQTKIEWVNVYTEYFGLCLYYVILSKIFKFKTIFHYVEFNSKIKNRNLILKLNDFLLDTYCMFLFDRYISISHFLENELKNKNKNIRSLIIPPICDFNDFNNINCTINQNEQYFLYCGSTAYNDVILFIISSFEKMNKGNTFKLYLVLNGKLSNELKERIDNHLGRIKLFTNLEYNKLICLYKNAISLLIPLRNIEQDTARFPQKICEYLASKKIIISTNFGEVSFFFNDMSNGLIANSYETNTFAKKMEWAVTNTSKLQTIEKMSYKTGKRFFDIEVYKKPVKELLIS